MIGLYTKKRFLLGRLSTALNLLCRRWPLKAQAQSVVKKGLAVRFICGALGVCYCLGIQFTR